MQSVFSRVGKVLTKAAQPTMVYGDGCAGAGTVVAGALGLAASLVGAFV